MALKSVLASDLTRCLVCASPYVHLHHTIYGTSNRKHSDRYGFIVPLCELHHTGRYGVHTHPNEGLDEALKKQSQLYYENNIGSREQFIKEFGRSWL